MTVGQPEGLSAPTPSATRETTMRAMVQERYGSEPGDVLRLREIAVGADVTSLQPGDLVFGIGESTFADYAVARPDKLARKPSNLTFVQAAAVPVSGLTALQAVRR